MISRLLPTVLSLVAAAPGDSALRVRIELIDGPAREVQLLEIDAGKLRYRSDESAEVLALDDLSGIQPLGGGPSTAEVTPAGPRVTVFLDPGKLRGQLAPAPHRENSIAVDVGLSRPLIVPFEAIGAVRFQDAPDSAVEKAFQARLAERPADKDLLLVAKGSAVNSFRGALEGLDDQRIEFNLGGRQQAIPLANAYAVILARPAERKATPRPAYVQLVPDQTLCGRIVSGDLHSVKLDAGSLGEVTLPWESVAAIRMESDRLVWLSDLKPEKVVTRFLLDSQWPPRMNASAGGGPLRLRGVEYPRGIGVHAFTSLTYRLGGAYDQFRASIGIDDVVRGHGSVVFRVLLDGRTAYESPLVRGRQPVLPIQVNVSGATEMTLECEPGADLDISDHADWAGAVLLRAKANPVR